MRSEAWACWVPATTGMSPAKVRAMLHGRDRPNLGQLPLEIELLGAKLVELLVEALVDAEEVAGPRRDRDASQDCVSNGPGEPSNLIELRLDSR